MPYPKRKLRLQSMQDDSPSLFEVSAVCFIITVLVILFVLAI